MGLFRRKPAPRSQPQEPATQGTATGDISVGVPGKCPECGGFGYIDRIDMVNRFQRQHCRECNHQWEYSFDDDGHVIDLTDRATKPDRVQA